MDLVFILCAAVTGLRGAMSSSGGAFRAAEAFVKSFVIDGDSVTFDRTALEGLRDFELTPGRCVCVFPVRPRVQNRYGTLHGGCVATLVDVVSTVALLTVSKDPGVSVNISTNYVSPGPGGTDVEVDARVTKVGRTLAFMDVTLRTKGGGKVVATGTHCKFLPNSQTSSKL